MRTPLALASLLFAASSASAQGDDGAAQAQLVIDVSAAGEDAGEPLGSVRAGQLRQGQTRTFSARLAAGRCYLFVGRGGAGLENLDLAVRRGRTALTRDGATGPQAEARHCAGDRPEQVRWSVTAFRGAGPFAAGVFALPAGDAGAEPEEGLAGSALERLDALARAHAADMRAVTPPRRETLAEGARVEREVTLAPGRCYRVLAAGEESIEDLDVALLGPDGGALQSDSNDASSAHLGVLRPLCPGRPGQYRVAARVHRGSGSFGWQVFGSVPRSSEAARAEASATRFRVGGTGSGFLAERVRARHRVAAEGKPPVTDLVAGTLRTSESHRIPLEVEGGRCYVVIGAGVPSVRELDLRVLDPYGNERATDRTRDAFPAASFCPSVSGRWTVEVRMFNGYGQWAAQAFGR